MSKSNKVIEMQGVMDFDIAFREMEKEPIRLKIFGAVEELPASIPATILTSLYNAAKTGKQTLDDNATILLLMDIIGEERYEKWCKKGLTMDQAEHVIKWLFEQYGVNGAQAKK